MPPSATYWLGTDNFGRDVLTRILYGARISLVVAIVPGLIALAIGTVMGILSGYLGGKTDVVVMWLADMMIAFPSLLLAMVVMYTLGANLLHIFLALALVGWASVARVVRSQTHALREKEFIEAARANGTARTTIMFGHIFPNVVPTLIVLFSLSIPEAIMWESSLSFLGVGVQPPGTVLIGLSYWILNLGPWIALACVSTVVMTLGEILTMPFANAFAMVRSNAYNRGRYLALYALAYSVAFIVAPLIGTQIAGTWSFYYLWYAMLFLSIVAGFGFIRLLPRTN